MDGAQPGKGIDPQMVRDHGADIEDLGKEIRDIEAEALTMQARLSRIHPMPRDRHRRHRWTRTG